MNSNVPIQVRPHLVAFFFREIEGEEVHYLKSKSKSFSISEYPSLSAIMRILLVITDHPVKHDEVSILLTINESENKKMFEGSFFKPVSGRNHFLKFPEGSSKIVNDLLEDIFNLSLTHYVLGHIESSQKAPIKTALTLFIEKYDLYELGFSYETLRKRFYRTNAKRIQVNSSLL